MLFGGLSKFITTTVKSELFFFLLPFPQAATFNLGFIGCQLLMIRAFANDKLIVFNNKLWEYVSHRLPPSPSLTSIVRGL